MNRPEVHGHRGSRGTHAENCLASFDEAVKAGADFFELDVHLSADGEVVVYHDPDLTSKFVKGLERPAAIRSLKAADIVRYEVGEVLQKKFPDQVAVPGQHIPLLDTVLKWVADSKTSTGVNIEIKIEKPDDPVRFAEKVIALVRKYRMESTCQIQSFDPMPLEVTRKALPKTRVSYLFEHRCDFGKEAAALGIEIVGPDYQLLTEATVQSLHARGMRVMPWTVNAPKDWRRLIDWGVDGIITDYPRRLLTELRAG